MKAIAIKPDKADAIYRLAKAYYDLDEYDKSIECFLNYNELQPNEPMTLFWLGQAHFYKENYDTAIQYYLQTIHIEEDKHKMFLNIGRAYDEKGDYQNAVEYYQKAIDLEPTYIKAHRYLGFLHLEKGDLQRAESSLKQAVLLGEADMGQMNLGHWYLAQKFENEALTCYKKSFLAFKDASDFWKDMERDFKHLIQYGITTAQWKQILEKIAP